MDLHLRVVLPVAGVLIVATALCAGAPESQPARDKAEPGVHDDLKVVLAPAKPVFGSNERLAVKYTFTNVGQKGEFALYNKLFDYAYSDDRQFAAAATIRVTNRDTQQAWHVLCAAEIMRKPSHFTPPRLAPGKSFDGTFTFEACLKFAPVGGKAAPQLPRGKYRLDMVWKFHPVKGSNIRWWQGEIAAEPIEFEVTDKSEA